ncbi:MAG: hypothetical protein PHG63_01615, partial [Candidatus Dojkabacteria bacterium]|nr:hypothetical protein [Candidatus Dojkabacteria bacterium]
AGETEPVTADNLYDKVLEIHREFTPGSTRKPVFLSNLANEIMRRILASPKDQWPQIASVIQQSLDERHLMLYLHNTNVQTVVQERGWGGHLENTRNPVFPVEWNWGANKANHFVDRSGSIQTSIQSEDQIKQSISLTYNNRSTENRYPEGDYVNFLRVYIPKGSTIIRIEGLSSVRSAFDETMGLHSVSGWITVPVNGSSSCSIEYAINRDSVEDFPLNLEAGGRISYHLSLIKQAGLQSDPWTIEITYPNGWEPIDLTNVHRELNALIQRTDLSVDRTIELMWER